MNMPRWVSCLSVVGILCLLESAAAQVASPLFSISGTNTLYGQYSNRTGSNQEIPQEFWRDDLSLLLRVYEIPIRFNVSISSQQSGVRQNVNRLSSFLDLRALARSKIRSKLTILSHFRALEVGTFRPRYSPLIFNGLPVSGIHVGVQPGAVSMAFAAGTTKKAIEGSPGRLPVLAQSVQFGRFGVGEADDSHLYLSLLHGTDDLDSVEQDSTSRVKPQENYVAGLDGRVGILDDSLELRTELAVSMLTRDTGSAGIEGDDLDIPSGLVDVLDPTISSSVDYAASAKSVFKISRTEVTAGVQVIGPGYVSFGAPNLRNDKLIYEGSMRQGFLGRRISVDGYLRRSLDDRADWKRATTKTTAFGLGATVRFPGLPHVRAQVAPHYQTNGQDSLKTESEALMVMATTGYTYRLGSLTSSTQLSYTHQASDFQGLSTSFDQKSHLVSLSESLTLPSRLTLTGSAGVRLLDPSNLGDDTWFVRGSGSYAGQSWRGMAGFSLTSEGSGTSKLGFQGRASIQVGKLGLLEVQAEQSFFRDDEDRSSEYDEFIMRSSLTTRW